MAFGSQMTFSDEIIDLGLIKVMPGGDKGRYPHCNTLFIDDEQKVIVDPACSYNRLKRFAEKNRVDAVIFSHYHEDHTRCAGVFKGAKFFAHPLDLPAVKSLDTMLEYYGTSGQADDRIWLNYLVNGLHIKDLPEAEEIADSTIDFGKTKATVIHTPGHTPGHICLFFSEQSILFSADIDLDSFGPYYGDQASSLENMLASIETVRQIGPKVMITGHKAGVVTENLQQRLVAYRDIIFAREEAILNLLERPRSLTGLRNQHPIYKKQYGPNMIFNLIEGKMIREHLARLVARKQVEKVGADLFVKI